MKGGWDLHRIQLEPIKQVHLVRRADGYDVQFIIKEDLSNLVPTELEPTKHNIGLDIGLKYFYVDSDGNQVQKSGKTTESSQPSPISQVP